MRETRSKHALLAAAVVSAALACSASSNGPVKTGEEAIAVAREAWKSTHEKARWDIALSEEKLARFEPYTATYENGVWVVRGTIPAGYHGEVIETRVRESDGSVSVTGLKIE